MISKLFRIDRGSKKPALVRAGLDEANTVALGEELAETNPDSVFVVIGERGQEIRIGEPAPAAPVVQTVEGQTNG